MLFVHKKKVRLVLITLFSKSQISFGPISWLMVSEIFPLRTRGRGISLAVLTNFGSNAIVTFAFSPLKVGVLNLISVTPFPFTSVVFSFDLIAHDWHFSLLVVELLHQYLSIL